MYTSFFDRFDDTSRKIPLLLQLSFNDGFSILKEVMVSGNWSIHAAAYYESFLFASNHVSQHYLNNVSSG
jgi:hypothetical protein